MKKLYENIEDIDIKGGVGQLSEMVTAMDISLQNIAENTDRLVEILTRYGVSNKGSQYEKVVNTSVNLREILYQESMELNEMQNQIVAYQNKIYRYEDMADSAQRPNPYLVTRKQISVDTSGVQFNRAEMVNVAASLRNYSEGVYYLIKSISEKKNAIGNVWRDTQYNDFSEFIDSVAKNIYDALKVYEEYVIYLEAKIKELS